MYLRVTLEELEYSKRLRVNKNFINKAKELIREDSVLR